MTCALTATLAGCGAAGGEHIPVDSDRSGALTPELRAACQLASRRCSLCHSLDRVLQARPGAPSHWQRYVERMRRMPASGIRRPEAPAIVRCLVFWSFGAAGLDALEPPGEADAL